MSCIPLPTPYELVCLTLAQLDLDQIARLCVFKLRVQMAGGGERYELTHHELWVGWLVWLIRYGRLVP